MEKNFLTKAIIAGAIIFVSIILWGFFLSASGITVQSLLEISALESVFGKILSVNFLAFLFFFPITYALIVSMAKVFDKRALEAIAFLSVALGGLATFFLFSSLQSFFVEGIFYLISIVVVVEATYIKFTEKKSHASLRVPFGAVSGGMAVLGIGVFVSTALFVLPVQEEIVGNFENAIFSGINTSEIKGEIADSTSQIIVQTQTKTLQQIAGTPNFVALQTKDDEDVKGFVTVFNGLLQTIQTPQYRQEVRETVLKRQSAAESQQDFGQVIEKARQKIPFYSLMVKYFWLFSAIGVASLFFLASNLVFKPLGALFGALFLAVVPLLQNPKERETQGQ